MTEFTVEQARNFAGMSQKEMADIIGTSKNAYIRKEKGLARFYIDEAYKFSEAVGISISNIVFFNRNVPKNGKS